MKHWNELKQYKTIIIGALLVLILTLINFWDASMVASHNEMNRTKSQLKESAQMERKYVDSYVEETESRLQNAAVALAFFDSVTSQQAGEFLEETQEVSPAQDIFLIQPDGGFLSEEEGNATFTGEELDRLFGGEMVVTPVFQTSNGRRALAFAVPVMRDGDVAYGLAAVYDTQLLAKALEMVAFEGKGLTSIIQADGTYVVRSMPYGEGADSGNFYAPGRMQFEDGYSLKQIKEEIARGKSGFFAFSTPGGMDHYAYYLPMGFNDWTVVTMAPAESVDRFTALNDGNRIRLAIKILILFALFMLFLARDLRKKNKTLENLVEELKISDQRFRVAANHVAYQVFEFDFHAKTTVLLNNRIVSRRGLTQGSCLNTEECQETLHPEDREKGLALMDRILGGEAEATEVLRIRMWDRKEFKWFRLTLIGVFDEAGNAVKAIGTLEDIDRERTEELSLREKAEKDPLTGLLNRAAGEKQIVSLLSLPEEEWVGECVLMVMDLDNFKQLNDTRGHVCGDRALCGAANLLLKTFRASDICARLGGDEFFVFMTGIKERKVVEERILQLQKALSNVEIGNGEVLSLSVSIGVVYGAKEDQFLELYQKADTALYQAKDNGKNTYVVFESGQVQDVKKGEAHHHEIL